MIDNSSSMADKQQFLAQAIPDLVDRLVHPACVNPDGTPANPAANCTAPAHPDFDPVTDIHVGIISSSLGGHGAQVCGEVDFRPDAHNLDMAHLLSRGAAGDVATYMNEGFLNWDGNSAAFINNFSAMVRGVGQHGCGYEASLEAVYRFLVDPEPYQSITIDPNPPPIGMAVPTGIDEDLLKQRADFLRPDSVVAVVEITDENDCSVIDGGQNFYVISPPVTENGERHTAIAHGTSKCLTNPSDACCFNCNQRAPDGCPDPAGDVECQKGYYLQAEDPESLRCFHQKQRYGMDFLYPVQRYIDGFRKPTVVRRDGSEVKNPLFDDLQCRGTGCMPARDPRLLFWAGIVGVPWQDLARNPRDLTQGYKTSAELARDGVWSVVVGNPQINQAPTDPLMIESIAPRTGVNPALQAPLAPPDSHENANPINGHEWDTSMDSPKNRDLQFACVFPLATPKDCALEENINDCDCVGAVASMKSPLCESGGAYTTTQVRAKAYPGTRHLQVLQGLGDQGIVASICPSNTSDTTAADFGYRPAVAAIVERLRPIFAH
jgi:hypothetical protein